jgi:hypothetical protein
MNQSFFISGDDISFAKAAGGHFQLGRTANLIQVHGKSDPGTL